MSLADGIFSSRRDGVTHCVGESGRSVALAGDSRLLFIAELLQLSHALLSPGNKELRDWVLVHLVQRTLSSTSKEGSSDLRSSRTNSESSKSSLPSTSTAAPLVTKALVCEEVDSICTSPTSWPPIILIGVPKLLQQTC
uniref:Uncharacterized protein n=1 Tax=Parascaris equorum TaxID=6256 RepID=A0A914R6P0_PAREQ